MFCAIEKSIKLIKLYSVFLRTHIHVHSLIDGQQLI